MSEYTRVMVQVPNDLLVLIDRDREQARRSRSAQILDLMQSGLDEEPFIERGGYSPVAAGQAPKVPPPKRADSLAAAVPPDLRREVTPDPRKKA